MQPTGLLGLFYRVSEWVTRVAYLNLLWIGFSLAGVVVVGFMPATTAMFVVVRHWLTDDADSSVFPVFWAAFRKEFARSNLLGLILAALGVITYVDLHFFMSSHTLMFQVLKFVTLGIALVYLATIGYVFPILATYDMPPWRVLVVSVFLGGSRPIRTVIILLACASVAWLSLAFPMPLFLINGSGAALLLTWNALKVLKKMDARFGQQR